MRVATWNPTAFDDEFSKISLDLLEQGAQAVAAQAKQIVPVAAGPRGGSLRETIRVVKAKDPTRKNVRVYMGSMRYRYAPFVEYGSAKIKAHHVLLKALHGANLSGFLRG
jgi:hypothetical protein